MTKRFLLLLVMAFTISCVDKQYPGVIVITNKSEHNITWVVVIDTDIGYAVLSERKNDLIVKNGGSYSFEVYVGFQSSKNFIVCVKAEDATELVCNEKFELFESNKDEHIKNLIYNGNNDHNWQPMQN